jgi:alpha-mannosidase
VTEPERANWQRRIAAALTGYVDLLFERARARVGGLVATVPGTERHLVFNPLSWTRTDVADLAVTTPAPRHVVDVTTGIEVPSQAVVVDGQPRVRIRASGVPSLGYRVYEVRPGAGATFPPAATVAGATLDNGLYAVTLGARGQITGVVDHKDGDRQLVEAGRALLDLGDGAGTVALEGAGPVSATLRVVSGGAPPHESRVTLHAGLDRIEYEGLLTGNFGGMVAYDSRFAFAAPVTRHEEVGMIARAARKAAGGDYADRNTRTDWLTFNHYVDVGETTRGAVLSAADSPFFRLGASTPTTLDAGASRIAAVVGMQVDGPGLGVADQGGDDRFPGRFALRTRGTWDPVLAMRFALEHQNPLVAAPVTGRAGAPLPATTWSLLQVGSPDVAVWAVKPAEDGIAQGLVVRLWNLAHAPRGVTLHMPSTFSIAAAMRTSHIETDLEPEPLIGGTLVTTLVGQELRTWRIVPDTALGAPPGARAPLLLEAWPNPVRSGAPGHVAFVMPAEGHARVALHDLRGARVATLADGRFTAGRQVAGWTPAGIRPGVYFLRFETGGRTVARRLAVLD